MKRALQLCAGCIKDVLDGEIEFTDAEVSITECSIDDCANNHLFDYETQLVEYE